MNEASLTGASRKVNGHNLDVGSPEESDGVIVPVKSANKGTVVPAESMEGRTPTKRNPVQEAVNRRQSGDHASIGLDRVRQRAETDKSCRFNNLFHFLKADLVRVSLYQLKRDVAAGLDGLALTPNTRGRSRMR